MLTDISASVSLKSAKNPVLTGIKPGLRKGDTDELLFEILQSVINAEALLLSLTTTRGESYNTYKYNIIPTRKH